MIKASICFRQISDLHYGFGDDHADIAALGVNMDDVEEGWLKKRRKKGDSPIRALIINIILRCADEVGAKVVLVDWSGSTSGGHHLLKQCELDKVSVLVQGLYHIKFSAVHQRHQGSGPDAVQRSVVANTLRIASLSAALTEFSVSNNFNHEKSMLGVLSCFQFVDPSKLLLPHDSSILTPPQLENKMLQSGETADDDDDDEEVQFVEVENSSQSSSIVQELDEIIKGERRPGQKPSNTSFQLPCLAGSNRRDLSCEEARSRVMDNLGLMTFGDGAVAFVDPENQAFFRRRQSELFDMRWNDMFSKLQQYKHDHGTGRVKKSHNESLYNWVNNQRTSGKAGNLSQDRMHRLDEIGFLWDASEFAGRSRDDGKWDDMFNKTKQYKHDHGDCRVKKSKDQKLYSWVRKQRKLRKNGNMPEDRIRRLNGINFE